MEFSNGRYSEHRVIDVKAKLDSQMGVQKNGSIGRKETKTHRPFYRNTLSSREMDSLVALCDTFIPSMDASGDDAVSLFYHTSASMVGTPQRVGGLFSSRVKHPKLVLARVTLWLLSTWIGTLMVCGWGGLSDHFPYLCKFSDLPLKQRECIVLSWTRSAIPLLRMLFRVIKLLVNLIFFTQLDENEHNNAWKAIGYCGADPNFNPTQIQDSQEDAASGPLSKGLIDLQSPIKDELLETLRKSGFPASISTTRKKEPTGVSNPSLILRCDAVVVGSGSGGGVVAGILAMAGYKVLVVEKGRYRARRNLSLLEGPAMDEMYLRSGLVVTADTGVIILSGSTVGGGSAINWSASIRTPRHVMKEWCDVHGDEIFGSEMYEEALDAVCERMGVQSDACEEGLNNAVLRRGCLELGYPVNTIPRNSSADHDCGWCCFGCKDGKKKGTLETWLVDLVSSGNGKILTDCEAIRVLSRGKKATGIAFEYMNRGVKEVCLVESKVTVVACGAVETPLLLRKSGLRNPNIGKNLHLHPVAMAWGYFPETQIHTENPNFIGKKSYEGAIMTAMSSVVGEFTGSGYGAVIQTPALHPGMFSSMMPWISSSDFRNRMRRFSRTAHVFALARDKGSGEVKSEGTISYKLEETDEVNLKKGIEKVLRILAAAGAEEIGTHHCEGKSLNVKKASSHEFERFVKKESGRKRGDLSTMICSAHQMGSCRMGVDEKDSAVKQTGETWEMEGLFVADTSVFPTALGVNPMVTVQAISYCTAQSIIQVLKRKKTTTTNLL